MRGSVSDELSTAQWMTRRRKDLERRGQEADAEGHQAWVTSTRTGQNLRAANPGDVRALGAQVLARKSVSAPVEDLTELRRRQAEFEKARRAESRKNSWMAVPALAPAAVVMGLEGAAALAARLAAPQLKRLPLNLPGKEPYRLYGDNWATRAGRRAHRALEERLKQKPGWDYEPRIEGPNGLRKPDVGAPARDPANPERRYQMELKPNTPSGRRAAKRAEVRYEAETGNKTRGIFYDPKDYK